jgi:phosphoribosylamine--glycine ligase
MAAPDTTVLLLGSGAREHAIAWKLAQSPRLKNLYAAPGSDAIAQWAQNLQIDANDPAAVVAAAQEAHAKLVFVGPEAPLAAGVSDALRKAGFAVFGPSQAGARLETSKAFAKAFMKRHGIPTAHFEVFEDAAKARAAAATWPVPCVVKADGLAAGKGVFVCQNNEQAMAAVEELMVRKTLGPAGETVIIEDGLAGPEVSLLALTDGVSGWKVLPPAQDHKRLKDNDEGPNTGGMGAYAPARVSDTLLATIKTEVLDRVMKGLIKEELDYRGVLFVGLMLTPSGPKVLEFNCRFGDPETQAILPVLDGDLLELALACANKTLLGTRFELKTQACVGITLASEGYPNRPVTGRPIDGLERLPAGALAFHAGTRREGGRWVTTGGRVLTICGLGSTVAEARMKAYAAAETVTFAGLQRRRDIAAKELSAA